MPPMPPMLPILEGDPEALASFFAFISSSILSISVFGFVFTGITGRCILYEVPLPEEIFFPDSKVYQTPMQIKTDSKDLTPIYLAADESLRIIIRAIERSYKRSIQLGSFHFCFFLFPLLFFLFLR
jgi:hypothetical protein